MVEKRGVRKANKYSKLVEEEYKSIEILSSSGGFSIVLKGENLSIGRVEALKVIDCDYIEDLGLSMAKVMQEITIMGKLDHKNVVKLYNTLRKTTEDVDYLFIVMEYCDSTLSHVLKQNTQGLKQSHALSYLYQMLAGVAYLHKQNIIHRDLKPENIFLKENCVKIGDFNISKDEKSNSTTTRPSQVLLTLRYSSPERLEGLKVDEKLDSWAIGCIYYEMIEGRRAFEGTDNAALSENIRNINYLPMEKVTELDLRIIGMTLVKAKERKTVRELKELIKKYIEDSSLKMKEGMQLTVFTQEVSTKRDEEEKIWTEKVGEPIQMRTMSEETKVFQPLIKEKENLNEETRQVNYLHPLMKESEEEENTSRSVVSCSWDDKLIFWGNNLSISKEYTADNIFCRLLLLHDGRIAASIWNGDIQFYNSENKVRREEMLKTEIEGAYSLCEINPQQLAVGGRQGKLKIFDIEEYKQKLELKGHMVKAPISCLKMHSKGMLMSASWDGSLRLWNYFTGECIKGFQDKIKILDIHELPNSTLLAINYNHLEILDLKAVIVVIDKRLLMQKEKKLEITSSLLHSSSQKLILGDKNGMLFIFEMESSRLTSSFQVHSKKITEIQEWDEDHVITCSFDNLVKRTNIGTGDSLIIGRHDEWVNSVIII